MNLVTQSEARAPGECDSRGQRRLKLAPFIYAHGMHAKCGIGVV